MRPVERLTIVGMSTDPGTRKRGSVSFAELPDSTKIDIPIVLINGIRPGPRIYLASAIHGDEVNGIAILSTVMAAIDPTKLAGQIICIPLQHPLAFHADHRLPLAQFIKSPLDQAPSDAWTCFPGSKDGNLAQQLAYLLFGIIRECDYVLDIHTPTRGGRYVPIAILPPIDLDRDGRIMKLAEGMGTGWIIRNKDGFYVAPGILSVEAARIGVPALTFEIGEGGRLEEDVVKIGASCILNALQSLDMIDIARKEPEQIRKMSDFVGLRAHHGGLLYNLVKLGQRVGRSDPLCRIVNIFGDDVETVTAPQDGFVVRTTTLSTVSTGDRVATLGV
jgi:predicted deacylase